MVDSEARAELEDRLKAVRDRIGEAAGRSRRDPSAVRLMAVTKTLPRATVEAALAAGLGLFGENRVQEAEEKYLGLNGDFELHLIGHLQRNKARAASALFRCVQSIDKLETAEALSRYCVEKGKKMAVLLELNTSGEASKSGFRSPGELLECMGKISLLNGIELRGLMTVGPLTGDRQAIRAAFARLASLFEEVRAGGRLPAFDTLSMGMSGDYDIAVEEGATMVRLGTALFGARS